MPTELAEHMDRQAEAAKGLVTCTTNTLAAQVGMLYLAEGTDDVADTHLQEARGHLRLALMELACWKMDRSV